MACAQVQNTHPALHRADDVVLFSLCSPEPHPAMQRHVTPRKAAAAGKGWRSPPARCRRCRAAAAGPRAQSTAGGPSQAPQQQPEPPCAAAAEQQRQAALSGACATAAACIGTTPDGYRGLLALRDLRQGELVISVPLHNVLQVPRTLDSEAAAAAARDALDAWTRHHGDLPEHLLALIQDPQLVWESKLVAWLLHLRTHAQPGSLWRAYCDALPAAADTLTFYVFDAQAAEQLQLGSWKAVWGAQQELLHSVQQQVAACYSEQQQQQQPVKQADVAWALSMVKSRTFGRPLPQQQAQEQQQVQQAELDPGDESGVVLLMVPLVDMLNHSPAPNCAFALDWQSSSFQITTSSAVPAGGELTISYGSNKSNLALASGYGFLLQGNAADAQQLAPMFAGGLAAAGIDGFDQALLAAAARAAREQPQQQQQQQQEEEGEQALQESAAAVLTRLQTPQLRAAWLACAAAALPAAPGESTAAEQLQQQAYLAQVIRYQVQQLLRLCGTSVHQDAAALAELEGSLAAAQQGAEVPLGMLCRRQAVAARLEQKLLLAHVDQLCDGLLDAIAARQAA